MGVGGDREGGEGVGKNLKKGDMQYRGGLHKIRGLGPLCQLWMRGVVDGKGQVTVDYQQKCN